MVFVQLIWIFRKLTQGIICDVIPVWVACSLLRRSTCQPDKCILINTLAGRQFNDSHRQPHGVTPLQENRQWSGNGYIYKISRKHTRMKIHRKCKLKLIRLVSLYPEKCSTHREMLIEWKVFISVPCNSKTQFGASPCLLVTSVCN